MVTFHDLAHKAFNEIYAMYHHIDILDQNKYETERASIEAINIDPGAHDIQEIGEDFRQILTKYCQENEISIDVQDLSNLPSHFMLSSGDELIYVNLNENVTCFVFIKQK